MIFNNITELIWNTPILKLPIKNTKWSLLLKLEKFNPWQSMKDRMALNMIIEAEKKWILKQWWTIIESSSWNTWIWLSIVSAQRWYKFIAVVDHHAAKSKIDIMKAYWAEIIYVKSEKWEDQVAVEEREKFAKELSLTIPNSFFPQQADNLDNRQAYYKTLWNELINETWGNIDVFIWAIWTWWSLSWTAERLKEYNNKIKIYWVEPVWSIIFWWPALPYYQSWTWNPWNVQIWKNVNYDVIDVWLKVWDKEAFNTARYIAKKTWILLWGSSWWILYKALEKLSSFKWSWTLIALMVDSWDKYLDTIFNDEWMNEKNLYDKNIEKYLSNFF